MCEKIENEIKESQNVLNASSSTRHRLHPGIDAIRLKKLCFESLNEEGSLYRPTFDSCDFLGFPKVPNNREIFPFQCHFTLQIDKKKKKKTKSP